MYVFIQELVKFYYVNLYKFMKILVNICCISNSYFFIFIHEIYRFSHYIGIYFHSNRYNMLVYERPREEF